MPLDITSMTDEQLRQASKSLAQLGAPQSMGQIFGAGLGGPSIGQELAQVGAPVGLQSPLLPGGPGTTPGVPIPPQGPQNPIPQQGFPLQAPPPQQPQGQDIGQLLNALSAVQPVAPPQVVNPPSGQTRVGDAALAQNLFAQLYGGGAGAPLPVRLTG